MQIEQALGNSWLFSACTTSEQQSSARVGHLTSAISVLFLRLMCNWRRGWRDDSGKKIRTQSIHKLLINHKLAFFTICSWTESCNSNSHDRTVCWLMDQPVDVATQHYRVYNVIYKTFCKNERRNGTIALWILSAALSSTSVHTMRTVWDNFGDNHHRLCSGAVVSRTSKQFIRIWTRFCSNAWLHVRLDAKVET